MDIIIRPETSADHAQIYTLTEAAFPNSTAHEADIVTDLRAASALTLSLVAADAANPDTVIGHVAFSPVTITPAPKMTWLGLGPISVAAERRGQGIGRRLIEEGVARIAALYGVQGCVLLGNPKLYNRFGFVAGQGLTLAGDVPPEYFMSRLLRDGDGPCPTGEVRFHPAFDQSLVDASAKH